ncbi:MAG TPA: class I SAM-dependent methyltransferase [Pyrinomonadaceae bacterium]
MSHARQTLESIQSDFDRIALLADEGWDHNAHYHAYLLNHIPARCRHALEIGCGTGEFSRLLAGRAASVLAIDLSPQMIRLARERSRLYPHIEFLNADASTYQLPRDHFDCIATLTTLHHLRLEGILRRIRAALRPGGVFLCLDLYRRSTPTDLFFDGVAYPASLLLALVKNGRLRAPSEVRAAYAEHGKTDSYPTLAQIERTCAEVLPGARLTRHLFWRYSIVWKKEFAPEADDNAA